MKKNLLQRVMIIAVVTFVGLWIVIGPRHRPTLKDFTAAGVENTLRENIHLGLDLRGGSHLVIQVQVPDYLHKLTDATANGVQQAATQLGYDVKEVRPEVDEKSGTYRIVLVANDPSKIQEMRDQLPRKVNDFDPNTWASTASGNTITWEMTDRAKADLGTRATQDAMKIIDSRINAIGVAEPTIQEHGSASSHQILLQMPGLTDPERVKALIGNPSELELMKVVGPNNPSPIQTYPTKEAAIASPGGNIPTNRDVLPYSQREEPTAAGQTPPKPGEPKSWVVVEKPAVVGGSELRSAEAVSSGPTGSEEGYRISFTLKPAGEQKFGAWTGANVGAYMAVVLNDEVQSAPFIKSQITDSGQIDGNFTKDSANGLALTLRSGALPARIIYLEERTVGPSLGADSIRAGA